MSSRALRKAQRERELQKLESQNNDSGDDSAHDEPAAKPANSKSSIFAMLGDTVDDDGDDEAEGTSAATLRESTKLDSTDEERINEVKLKNSSNVPTGKRKKKKKPKSKLAAGPIQHGMKESPSNDTKLDDIDLALKSLSISSKTQINEAIDNKTDIDSRNLYKLLSIDNHHLNVSNEMKRLFGRAAFDVDQEEEKNAQGPRQLQPNQPVNLAEAIAGRNSSGGSGLTAVLRRRSAFIHGKEDWPRMTGSGLGMDVVEKDIEGIIEYRYVHNLLYQNQQEEFEMCVSSMDASLLVNQLRFNSYHISTLLQVSEIAKQEKDYSTSGDLLERALFSFGRAVHSTFAANMAQGHARLDFRRPENREFWLAAWRYINNISMRATWRTAYEWVKLLLSLDPENDPYCIRLVIDQFAIRSRQAESFLDLSNAALFSKNWSQLPNIKISRALALLQVHQDEVKAKAALREAVECFPWIFARLFKELDIDNVPPVIWGQTATTKWDILTTELYATRAKDLWKSPEAKSFLQRTISDMHERHAEPQYNNADITLNEARFIILTDEPHLIGLLPSSMTSRVDSMSDPLPPDDNLESYPKKVIKRSNQISELSAERQIRDRPNEFIWEIYYLQDLFERLVPGFSSLVSRGQSRGTQAADASNDDGLPALPNEALDRALIEIGMPPEDLLARLTRLMDLRAALLAEPNSILTTSDGDEAELMDDGRLRIVNQGRPMDIAPGRLPEASERAAQDDSEAARERLE